MRTLRYVCLFAGGLCLLVRLIFGQGNSTWHDPSPHLSLIVTVGEGVRLEVLDWGGEGRLISAPLCLSLRCPRTIQHGLGLFLFLDHTSGRDQDFEISWWLLTLAQSHPPSDTFPSSPTGGSMGQSVISASGASKNLDAPLKL